MRSACRSNSARHRAAHNDESNGWRQTADQRDQGDKAFHHMRSRWHRHLVPSEKDATELRKLLKFYFEPFNLQHNRVFMSLMQAKKSGKRRDEDKWFSIKEICCMPRIQRLFDSYDPICHCGLLAAALQTQEELPVQLCSYRQAADSRGAWASSKLWLELRYSPVLRFIESPGRFLEVKPLIEPEINALDTVQALAENAFLVLSYSVSSDLSHSESPKAEDLAEAVGRGNLDPCALFWETRQQKLKRQLLWQPADIICVQGIQSIGFCQRCSETDARWFSCENEPAVNHLVHLYRDLAKGDYGVAFAPALKMPGSAVICFGNAVFWKKSRWQFERRWSVGQKALCVQLSSLLECPDLLVCCSKPPGVYAVEWGEALTNDELMRELLPVQSQLLETAASEELRPLWCGDFGMGSAAVMSSLDQESPKEPKAEEKHAWQNACGSVFERSPWTSASRFTAGNSTDVILHDESLRVLAVLGGLPVNCDQKETLKDLLRCGFPSDHLMQMAAFSASGADLQHPDGDATDQEAQPSEKLRRVGRRQWKPMQDSLGSGEWNSSHACTIRLQ